MSDTQKRLITEQAEEDAQRLLQILKTTPVIEQPEKSMEFVRKLSKKLRAKKWFERERVLNKLNEKSDKNEG